MHDKTQWFKRECSVQNPERQQKIKFEIVFKLYEETKLRHKPRSKASKHNVIKALLQPVRRYI